MRKKVRGLRTIEQAVLARPKAETKDDLTPEAPEATVPATAAGRTGLLPWSIPPAPWCSTIARRCVGSSTTIKGGRCILPALRMAEALNEVHASLQRNLDEKKGDSRRSNSAAWPDASRGAWTKSRSSKRSSEDTSR